MRKIYGNTDIGLVRANNQDRFEFSFLSDDLGVAVLCDGMGGEQGGGVASKIAVEYAKSALERDLAQKLSELSIRATFESIIATANTLVYEQAQADDTLKGMGTTMILALIYGGTLYTASVGDSRVYVADPTRETQVTTDHTVVQIMLDKGEISVEEAQIHPQRHFITRAVGVSPMIQSDFFVFPLAEQDVVLLCSDGLYSYLQPGTLYHLLARSLAAGNVDELIELAKDGGGSDNITAVVMA